MASPDTTAKEEREEGRKALKEGRMELKEGRK
jgi:hypothetical protein